ncbi:synaptic vesicle glycoprotein 2B [Trichonephila clavipes]|nr:synaptic vesicle glycoprotein 2B [Trichonephila clavipes]
MDTKRLQFGRWRKFLLICSIPAIVSAVGVSFLPESPRFLLEMGRNSEAIYVYKQIFSWNNAVKSGEEYQLTELEVPGKRPTVHVSIPSNRGILREMLRSVENCWNNISGVFASPHTFLTLFLLVIWTTTSFGFYGISIWLHEYTKVIEDNDFESRTIKQADTIVEDKNLNTTLENTHFTNLSFINVRFVQTLINHCTFYNCSFTNCTFSNIRTSRTYFRNCEFIQTEFLDTDLYPNKFQACSFNYSDFFNTKGRPRVTTPNENRYLAVTAKRNRRSTASDLSRQLSSATGTTVSRQTVYRRLGHIGLYARRPVRCVQLTATHCRLRLTCSREHALWTPQQWYCMMFSDESRFSLQSDSRRTLIWRAPGTCYHQENTIERHRYGGAGWHAFGEELFWVPDLTCMFRV